MSAVYSIAYALAAVICAAIARAAWKRRPAPGALGLALLCAGQSWWSAAYALQWTFTDRGPSLFWLVVRAAGLQVTPTAILVLVLDYTGRSRLLSRRNVALLLIQPVSMFLLLLIDRLHGFYLGGHEPVFTLIMGGPGWLFNHAYSYLLILLAAALLIAQLPRRHAHRMQTAVLFVAVMLPVVQYLVQLTGVQLLPQVNTVPFIYTITGLMLWLGLTRLGLFKVIPVARSLLVEQMAEGVIVFDSNRLIADINPAAMRMTGVSTNCIGQTADEAFPDQAEAIAALRAALRAGRAHADVHTVSSTGGVVEATASIVAGSAGERLATLVTLRDITEQTRAAIELQKRSEKLAAALERSSRVLEAMTDGVLLASASGVLLHSNPSALRILGAETLDGRSLDDVLPMLPARELITEAVRTGSPASASAPLPDDRSLTVEVIPLLAAEPQGAHSLLVIRDETERLAAEHMQRDFVASAAHELQTPLTGLSLLAGTIPRALRDDPESVDGFVARLAIEVERLILMTNALLALSEVDEHATADEHRVVDLTRIVAGEVDAIGPLALAEQQTIALDATGEVWVSCDEAELGRVVGNLLGNAVRYTGRGGRIEVRVTIEADPDGLERAVLSVSDNGIGIRPQDQERIFERFYRADKARSRRTGGAGLGLSIVRATVERHGGKIAVESVPGEGSTFTVRLPLAPAA